MRLELVTRYVFAVVNRLPAAQRADIEKELHGLIEDMLDERVAGEGMEVTTAQVEEVLLELGPPVELAAKYSGGSRFLIGPELFTSYVRVLKVVGLAIVIAMSVLFILDLVNNVTTERDLIPTTLTSSITKYIGTVVEVGLQGFAWVTVIFGLLEYKGVKANKLMNGKKKWKPSDLAPIPDPKLQIKRLDPIFSIIFTVLFATLFIHSADWFGVLTVKDGDVSTRISFFNAERIASYEYFIWAAVALMVLKDSLKLIAGKWSKNLIIYHSLLNGLILIAAILIFNNGDIWNPEFINQLMQQSTTDWDFDTVISIWNNVTSNFVYLVVLIFVIDFIAMMIKAYRFKSHLS